MGIEAMSEDWEVCKGAAQLRVRIHAGRTCDTGDSFSRHEAKPKGDKEGD